jgi:hypothetical protein
MISAPNIGVGAFEQQFPRILNIVLSAGLYV